MCPASRSAGGNSGSPRWASTPTLPERVHGVKAQEKAAHPGTKPIEAGAKKVEPALVTPAAERAAGERPAAEKPASGPAFTKAFSDALIRLAERDVRVHAITAAMPSGTGLDAFAERFPARFHDTGITEQHACAMAAGMAKGGLRPVAAIYSTFLQRGYDQVFQEVALQGLPVVFALDRAGLVGQDGPTHNGVFDIAFLRTFPGIVLAAPRDATDVERMLELGCKHDRPFFLRFPRDNCPSPERIHRSERRAMMPGKAEVLREGDAIWIWASGALVGTALEAAERLGQQGLTVGVVDARFAKPLDTELLRGTRRLPLDPDVEAPARGRIRIGLLEALNQLPNARRACGAGGAGSFHGSRSTREEQLAEPAAPKDRERGAQLLRRRCVAP